MQTYGISKVAAKYHCLRADLQSGQGMQAMWGFTIRVRGKSEGKGKRKGKG